MSPELYTHIHISNTHPNTFVYPDTYTIHRYVLMCICIHICSHTCTDTHTYTYTANLMKYCYRLTGLAFKSEILITSITTAMKIASF